MAGCCLFSENLQCREQSKGSAGTILALPFLP